jgi:hypothetical protein
MEIALLFTIKEEGRGRRIDLSVLDLGIDWNSQLYIQTCFILEERDPGAHWIGGWVDSETGLDGVEERTIFSRTGDRTPISRLSIP